MKFASTQAILSFVTAMAATPSWGAAASSLRKLQAPDNDSCSGATLIAVGETIVGSTSTATADAGIGYSCGTLYDEETPGVWYTVTGTGAFLEANTCGGGTKYNTKLFVYGVSCDSLTCITGNDDGDASCWPGSRVSWYASPGVVYYIFVHGFRGDRGSFELQLQSVTPPDNDSCSEATPIAVGETISGSTSYATADANIGIGPCGTTTFDGTPGVWYTVIGTDAVFEANTCGGGTNYNTKLHVFSGSCGPFVCVTGNDNDASCGSGRSRVSWDASPGVVYYIFVHGYGSATGNFQLQLQCNADTTPPQVLCEPGVNPGGEEPDPDSNSRFYKLVGLDDCSEPALYVRDTVSGTEFGQFESGTYIKYVAAKGHIMPSMSEMNGDVDYFMIKGKGPAEVVAVDGAGNNATTLCA